MKSWHIYLSLSIIIAIWVFCDSDSKGGARPFNPFPQMSVLLLILAGISFIKGKNNTESEEDYSDILDDQMNEN